MEASKNYNDKEIVFNFLGYKIVCTKEDDSYSFTVYDITTGYINDGGYSDSMDGAIHEAINMCLYFETV